MQTSDHPLAPILGHLLARRETELRCALREAGGEPDGAPVEPDAHEVMDFKELAALQCVANIEQAKARHARGELRQVVAARRRLADHTYGSCLDCGDPINARRLAVLPATPLCAECQTAQERARGAPARNH